jgi:hypothetical protein
LETHNAARAAKGLPPQEAEQIVEQYIKLLTQYNHVKDATQLVFDKVRPAHTLESNAEQLMLTDNTRPGGVLLQRSPSFNSCLRATSMHATAPATS